jgi:drug/metabolite transporter (DMT)-like permease
MLLYIQVVERIGVTKASAFTNLIPIITAIGAWVILPDESLNLKLVSGILIVVTGIYIGQKGESKN